MKLNLTRPLVSFDLETTGKDTATCRIVEMAFFKIFPDGHTEGLHQFVNPGMPIPAEVTEIHGITDAHVAHEPPFKAVAHSVMEFLKGCDLLGFNCIAYDVPVLWYEFQRAGVNWNHTEHQVIDAGNLYKMLAPRTLVAAVMQYLGKDHSGAHSAFHDASATTDVLLEQLERHGELPTSVDELALYSNFGVKRADVTGKFTVNETGEYVLNFGANRGQLARQNASFLGWMLTKDFPKDALAICRSILYPTQNAKRADVPELPL